MEVVQLVDYAALPAKQRNILRLRFCNPTVRTRQPNWENVARLAVGTFRADAARASAIGLLVSDKKTFSPNSKRSSM